MPYLPLKSKSFFCLHSPTKAKALYRLDGKGLSNLPLGQGRLVVAALPTIRQRVGTR